MNDDYRIQVYIRRKGEPVFEGNEFKSELFDDLDSAISEVDKFIEDTILEDQDGRDENDSTD